MKLLTTIVFTLLLSNLSAQDSTYYRYNSFIKKATDFAKQSELKKALDCYDTAFMLIDFVYFDYYDAFILAIDDSDFLRANDYAINGTLKGLKLSHFNSPELTSYERSLFGIMYWNMKDSLLKEHYLSIDTAYYREINEMFTLDQSVRHKGIRQMEINDSLNFERLINLCEQKGFPTFQKVGNVYSYVEIILWHNFKGDPATGSAQWKKILPLISIEIFKGTLDPDYINNFEEMWERRNVKK